MQTKLRSMSRALRIPPVVSGEGGQLFLERGSADALADAERVALVASWSPVSAMSRSVSEYLSDLDSSGYVPVLISVSPVRSPLTWPYGVPDTALVLRRRNIGYDFGSWAAALNAFPLVRNADHVLLTNDSMVGPFLPLAPLFERAEGSQARLVALTDSYQIQHTVQSYFLLFNGGVLAAREWRHFFNGVRPQRDKMAVVFKYEAGVASECVAGAFGWEALFPTISLDVQFGNPTLEAWRPLLDAGFPFVKRTLFWDAQFSGEASQAARYLSERFGEDVNDWLPEQEPI